MDPDSTKVPTTGIAFGVTTTGNNFVLPEERSLTDRFMSLAVRMMVNENYRRGDIIRHMVSACCGMLAAENEASSDQLIDAMKEKIAEIRENNFKKNRIVR